MGDNRIHAVDSRTFGPVPLESLSGVVLKIWFSRDPQTGKAVTSVFLPTSPNPMTGFVVIVDNDKLIERERQLMATALNALSRMSIAE